ncbi:hypothetical protein OCS_01098 [Ophiocordyceps sinensis CO18]|uniref:Uncharacterized protein n=1 Tax=Ophiocordyceps sinensis (strain Co18 / CGMCC 3.14243) TaxID=911162 RepID=T5ACK1_OPHSC|nr:hypothetical protein OCS_01098 [Ophiocordyceps sinensis CO18]
MAPIPAGHDSVHRLEAGLLGTWEEEKASLIETDSQGLASKGHHQQQPTPRKMTAIRRLAVAIIVGLFVGLGLSLAKNAGPCLGAAHRIQGHEARGHGLASTIAELVKRQSDGGGSNATAASVPSSQATSAPASTQAPTSSDTTPSDSSTNSPAATSSAPEPSSTPVSSASSRAPESSSRDTSTSATSPETTPASSRADPTTSSQAPPATSATSTPRQASPDSHGEPRPLPRSSSHPLHRPCPSVHILFVFIFSTLHLFNHDCFHDKVSVGIDVYVPHFWYVQGCCCLLQQGGEDKDRMYAAARTFARDEATTTTSDATSRETITAGEVSTSSAVRKTWTTTLGDGGVKVLTSTSWVAVVPSAAASAKGNSKDADLQNAAGQNRGAITFAAAAGALVAGFVLI